MIKMVKTAIGMTITTLIIGCANLLPTVEQKSESRWKSYEDTKQSFDKIMPEKTTANELNQLGFDPFENPNIRLLNYLDITRLFLPNESLRLHDLDPSVRTCLEATTACQGYEISPKITNKKRYGNVALDVLNFRRRTRTTGWNFQGLIILNKDLVVYKLESGQPNMLELEDRTNPLGPLQEISITPSMSSFD